MTVKNTFISKKRVLAKIGQFDNIIFSTFLKIIIIIDRSQ